MWHRVIFTLPQTFSWMSSGKLSSWYFQLQVFLPTYKAISLSAVVIYITTFPNSQTTGITSVWSLYFRCHFVQNIFVLTPCTTEITIFYWNLLKSRSWLPIFCGAKCLFGTDNGLDTLHAVSRFPINPSSNTIIP